MKLTDRQVKNLKPTKQRYELWEGRGFGIRVFPTGKKSWVYMYRFEGKARRITFGQYPKMGVAQAHIAFSKAKHDLELGIDPGNTMVQANCESRQAPTVERLVDEYLEKWAKPNKRSWQEDQRVLHKDILPAWGKRKAKAITRRDVVLLIDKIVERGSPIIANRTLAIVRRMFNFAIERDILTNTPCLAIKLPSKENRRDRMLSETEIKIFWSQLDQAGMAELTKLALKLQLVTAQRKGEIVGAEWAEFNLQTAWWEIPAAKAKNSKLHRVPLSELALSILEQIKPFSGDSQWLFPSPTGRSHISGPSIDHAIRRNQEAFKDLEHFTPHDLRRTAASHMTALGIPRLIVSKILNHSENSVTAIYDRHSYDTEKQEALVKWGDYLNQLHCSQVASIDG